MVFDSSIIPKALIGVGPRRCLPASIPGFDNIHTHMACFTRQCTSNTAFPPSHSMPRAISATYTNAGMATTLAANPQRSGSSIRLGLCPLPLGLIEGCVDQYPPNGALILPIFLIQSIPMYRRYCCPQAFVGATSGKNITLYHTRGCDPSALSMIDGCNPLCAHAPG